MVAVLLRERLFWVLLPLCACRHPDKRIERTEETRLALGDSWLRAKPPLTPAQASIRRDYESRTQAQLEACSRKALVRVDSSRMVRAEFRVGNQGGIASVSVRGLGDRDADTCVEETLITLHVAGVADGTLLEVSYPVGPSESSEK